MKKIIIAEDDKFLANAYQMKFSKFGYEITLVVDGEELISLLETNKPDLIILDLVMPAKDGVSVLQELRRNTKWKSIPVIVVTNLDQKEDIKKCQDLGISDYIMKNKMSLERLHDKIRVVVGE
ncbi:response regulator [Candidatus Woesebacteria bacterium]|nr:response regulator [Candidatus Woesebacteria bacterium]